MCLGKLDMRRLVTVPVNIVGDLCQQDSLWPKNPKGFKGKRGIHEVEVIAFFLWRLRVSQPRVEVLGAILTLVGDMWRIVDDHVGKLASVNGMFVLSPTTSGLCRGSISMPTIFQSSPLQTARR